MRKTSTHHIVLIRSILLLPLLSLCLWGPAQAQAAAPPGYRLIGTIQSRDFSGATISVKKGEQDFFRLLDKLPDGSQIIKVLTDNIVLRGPDGSTYEMFISHEPVKRTTAQKHWNVRSASYAQGRGRPPGTPRIADRHRPYRNHSDE